MLNNGKLYGIEVKTQHGRLSTEQHEFGRDLMDGDTLSTLIDELNGGASIGSTLKFQLVNAFKATLEQERPWMVLRKTDASKSITASNTWQKAIGLSTLRRFNRFHGWKPIRLFDGSNRIVRYSQVPMDDRRRTSGG